MVNAAHPQKNKDDAPMISEEQHIKNIDKQVSLASDKPEPNLVTTLTQGEDYAEDNKKY